MPPDTRLRIELTVLADHPQVLAGLESLLKLGLISDTQIRQVAAQTLTCVLPPFPTAQLAQPQKILPDEPVLPEPSRPQVPALGGVSAVTSESWLVRGLQAWMAELSVRWLLLLGVFLVVLSSAVLAASQWQSVSPVGQYGILCGYTLAFWGASVAIAHRPGLRLTQQMLALTTLLIIPVNFWVMDGFGLFQDPVGLWVAIAAALGLTEVSRRLLRPYVEWRNATGLVGLVALGLPWLHWGWRNPGAPLVATYVGAIAMTLALVWADQGQWPRSHPAKPDVVAASASTPVPQPPPFQFHRSPVLWITLLSSVLLLVGRAIGVEKLPVSQFGLTLSLCGWLMAWLVRRQIHPLWTTVGVVLLLAGRVLAIPAPTPWQALIASGLSLGLFGDWLQRHQSPLALRLLWLAHLQALRPLWRLVPDALQAFLGAQAIAIFGSQGMPFGLLGIVLFPDMLAHLKLAHFFRQRQQLELARQTDRLAIVLGAVLTGVSLFNPWMRSLNLTASALTLITVERHRRPLSPLFPTGIYLLTISAIAAWIHAIWPQLPVISWATCLLAGAIGLWGMAGWQFRTPLWQTTTWCFGLILSSLSYLLALLQFPDSGWAGVWFIAPITLTVLGFRTGFPLARASIAYSTVLLVVTPLLTVHSVVPRLLGFAIATAVLVVNSRRLSTRLMAFLAVGMGITGYWATVVTILDHLKPVHSVSFFLSAPFILTGILWGLRDRLRRQTSQWQVQYQPVLGAWAMVFHHGHLLGLSIFWLFWPLIQRTTERQTWENGYLAATLLGCGVMAYRLWQVPGNWGFGLLAWNLELVSLIVTVKLGLAGSWLQFGLAVGTLIAGQIWTRYTRRPYWSSWHWIPIAYALLGNGIQHLNWNEWSGLGTWIVAGIGLVVARRSPKLRWLTYVALSLVTLGSYELLLYQLLQSKGGQPGDGVMILSLVAAGWTGIYRLPLMRRLLSLSALGLRYIAHTHWGLGNALVLGAVILPLSYPGQWGAIGVTAGLAAYAIGQGRISPAWIYVGLTEACLAIAGSLHLVLLDETLRAWGGAIAVVIATGLCRFPWRRWGWAEAPWHNSASLLPGLVLLLTLEPSTLPTRFLVAGFYVGFAQFKAAVRWSYISVLITDWAVLKLLHQYGWSGTVPFISLVAASVLYVAEIDPKFQRPNGFKQRHWLRLFAITLLSITVLHESDGQFLAGLWVVGLGFGIASLGVFRRVRAFLYGGTALFLLKLLRQLWLFIADYSLVLWAIGIAVGLLLIWVAATFESRRNETLALLRHWQDELAEWE